jgi:hypothetical protein
VASAANPTVAEDKTTAMSAMVKNFINGMNFAKFTRRQAKKNFQFLQMNLKFHRW